MRFYQMTGEEVATALSSNCENGVSECESTTVYEPGRKFTKFLRGICKEIRRKFLPIDVISFVCFLLAIIFSLLNKNWNLLFMISAAIVISLASYISLAAVLCYYRNRFKKRIADTNHSVAIIRGGKEIDISVDQLIAGDVLLLKKGMILPADARVLVADELYADENYVFSTSIPARKSSDAISGSNLLPEMQENMLWKGSFIAKGNGRAIITAIGEDCYIEKTGGRAKRKQHSWFYNKQRNLGQFASLAYIFVLLLGLFVAVIATFRFVEIIFLFGIMSSFIALNPVSLLTEWSYYRTAESLYQKGAHIRNIEAFDGMNNESVLYYSADELIEQCLRYDEIIPMEENARKCLSYFALCIGQYPISSLIVDSLTANHLSYEQLDRTYPVFHTERDDKGCIFSMFAGEGQSIVVATGYWQNMLCYVNYLNDESIKTIETLESEGKMVWLLAVTSIDSIPNQLDFSTFFKKMNSMCTIQFDIQKEEEAAQKIFELQKSKAKIVLVNTYSDSLCKFITELYGIDDCISTPPEQPCYTLPHLKKNPYVVYGTASPIAQERAHLVLFGDISSQEVIYRVKCMFCGIKRSLGFIACFSLLMIATVVTLFLRQASLVSIIYPALLMKLMLICPSYYLIETVGNCNQYSRSMILGAFCGAIGFISAILGFDSAMISMGLSAVFLSFTMLLSVRRLRRLRMKDLYILFSALLLVLTPWIFIGGNWIASILFACFPSIAAYIINLFY